LDQPASVELAKHTLMSGGLILAVGTIAGLFAQKTKIPDVAVFLMAGMLIGPQALGLIDIKADSALYQILLLFGASYILFDGGASLRFAVIKEVWITIVLIATVGVAITTVITSVAAHWILAVPWIVASLLGATLSSTDPATLIPIFRQVHIRDRVAQTIMGESALDDATGAIVLWCFDGGDRHRRIFVVVVFAEFADGSDDRHRRWRRARLSRCIIHRARALGVFHGICAGGDYHGGHRRIFCR
jgi:potassium/hydrogen antiporter